MTNTHGSAHIDAHHGRQSVLRLHDLLACRVQFIRGMAISSLLRRMGFLKLGDYGLVLTPEGRLLSCRPAVLDDGFGGKIVGWREGDLAAMELARWQSPPASPRATASPSTIPAPISAAPSTRRVALAMAPVGPTRARTPITLEAQPMIRVDEIEKDEPLEDEWEWEIAVARARAQAEWSDEALSAAQPVSAPVAPASSSRMRAKSQTSPIAVIAAPVKPLLADRWDTSDRTKTAISAAPAPLPRNQQPTRPVQIVSPGMQTCRTVIPIPSITQVTNSPQVQPRTHVSTGPILARPPASVMAAPPRRFPRATGQATKTASTQTTLLGQDTQVTLAAPAANDDLTSPGLLFASSNATSSNATSSNATSSNAKRVAAKQR